MSGSGSAVPVVTSGTGSSSSVQTRAKPILVEGDNEIEIEFSSAVDYCQEQASTSPYPVPSVRPCSLKSLPSLLRLTPNAMCCSLAIADGVHLRRKEQRMDPKGKCDHHHHHNHHAQASRSAKPVAVLPCREDAILDGTGDRVSCPAASSDRSDLWPSPSSQKSARSRVIKCTTSRSTLSRCISPYWYAHLHSLNSLVQMLCQCITNVMAIPSPHATTVDRCK
jgi:hypothetical protein